MQLETRCWVAWLKFIGYFCMNGNTTLKAYDVVQMSGVDLSVAVTSTVYFDEDNNPVVPTWTDILTEGSCSMKPEFDKSIWCEVDTNGEITWVKVQIITTYSVTGEPTNAYYNLVTWAVWTGDPETELVQCPSISNDIESDKVAMCDNDATPDPVTFFRWYVKDNGEPTGVYFDTDKQWQVYVPVSTDPTAGYCRLDNPFVLDSYNETVANWNTATYTTPWDANNVTIWQVGNTPILVTITFNKPVAWNNTIVIPMNWVVNYDAPAWLSITSVVFQNTTGNTVWRYVNAMN